MQKRYLAFVFFMLFSGIMGQAWAGSISGTVTGNDPLHSGATVPLNQILMYLYTSTGVYLENTLTVSADGSYSFICSQGSYIVEAASQPDGYIPDSKTATLDIDEDNKIVTFNLGYGGSFSGTVTDESTGSGIGGVTIYAYENGSWAGTAISHDDGNYLLGGLPGGTYQVEAYSDNYINSNYPNTVSVDLGTNTPNINFILERQGAIQGNLIYADNDIDSHIQVMVYTGITSNDWINSNVYVKSVFSDNTGYFKISGLSCGKCYRLQVNTTDTDYINAYYPDQVCLLNCGISTLADAGSLILQRGGGFKGKLVDKDTHKPISGITVNAYTCIDTAYTRSAHTDIKGNFEINGLTSGTGYTIEINTFGTRYISDRYPDCHIVSQVGWIGDLGTLGLARGGYITGVVKNTLGVGINHMNVRVLTPDDITIVADTYTRRGGTFEVGGLPLPATYIVIANAYGTDYEDKYYNNVSIYSEAVQIHLDSGASSYALPHDIELDTHVTTTLPPGTVGSVTITKFSTTDSYIDSSNFPLVVIGDSGIPTGGVQVEYSTIFSIADSDLTSDARAKAYTFKISGGDIFIFSFSNNFIPSAVWFPYDPNKVPSSRKSEISLKHYTNGQWEDVTILSVDTVSHRIKVSLNSYSPFAIIYPVVSSVSPTGGDGGGGGGGGKGGCFIATAAYGTPFAREVQVLRNFRDAYLLTNDMGQGFVSFYYKYSPPIAGFIRDNSFLRAVVRTILRPVVWLVQNLCPQCSPDQQPVSAQQPQAEVQSSCSRRL